MTEEPVDLRIDQEIVIRLRTYAHIAHAAASWGFAGEGFWMDRGADLIEEQVAEIERLGRELNKAKYGNPDFAWEAHQAAMVVAQAEIERLHFLLAEKALDEMVQAGEDDGLLNEAVEIERLRDALGGLLHHYLALANSGDAGFWEPEEESIVIESRAALNEKGPGD